jgi:hypothetical protein
MNSLSLLCGVGNGGKVLAGTTVKKPKQSKVAQNFPDFLIKDVTLLRQTSYCYLAPPPFLSRYSFEHC